MVEGQLLGVKGVVSFTFSLSQRRCFVRVRSDINAEVSRHGSVCGRCNADDLEGAGMCVPVCGCGCHCVCVCEGVLVVECDGVSCVHGCHCVCTCAAVVCD